MAITLWTNSEKTAQKNMDFDRSLLKKAIDSPTDTHIRVYEWLTPGVTYPDRQILPPELAHIDHGHRPTGGGIVFHSPGDIVICIIIPKPKIVSPRLLHGIVSKVATLIQIAFQSCGLNVSQKTSDETENSASQNLAFCKTYFSPSELYFNGNKMCGLTLKRYKDHILIQGVIHLQDAKGWFKDISPEFTQYLHHAKLPITSQEISEAIQKKLTSQARDLVN